MTASSRPSRWTPRRRRGPSAAPSRRPSSDLRGVKGCRHLGVKECKKVRFTQQSAPEISNLARFTL
eukprot:1231592-Prymnesium_polylepis.1